MCIRDSRNGNAKASFVMDHGRFGPQGALGGGDGDVNKVVVFRDGESYVPLHLSKEQDIPLETGDRVWVRTPGGGGYGDPLQRSAALVLEDVRLERYTIEQAADLYGVVLLVSTGSEGNHGLTLDEIATEARRATLRASR